MLTGADSVGLELLRVGLTPPPAPIDDLSISVHVSTENLRGYDAPKFRAAIQGGMASRLRCVGILKVRA